MRRLKIATSKFADTPSKDFEPTLTSKNISNVDHLNPTILGDIVKPPFQDLTNASTIGLLGKNVMHEPASLEPPHGNPNEDYSRDFPLPIKIHIRNVPFDVMFALGSTVPHV